MWTSYVHWAWYNVCMKVQDLKIQKGNAPRGTLGSWVVVHKSVTVAWFARKPNRDSLHVLAQQLS